MKSIQFVQVFLILTTSPGICRGQGAASFPATISLTLAKAEELALAGNPHIHAADERAQAASKQAPQDLSPADPVFMIDKTTPGMETWMVDEDLGFPGKSLAKADVDGAETKRLQAMALDTRRSILFQARQAFWDFYFRQKAYALLGDAQKQWKVLGQALQSRELTGQWLSLKAVRAQMETAKSANGLLTAGKSLRVSQFNLNHLFNQPHGTDYALSSEPSLPPFEGSEEDYVQKTLKGNPAIAASRRVVEAQDARKNLAALDHLPDFNVRLSGLRDPAGSGFSDYGFRVGISIPLFFPAKQGQALGQAADELAAARFDLQGAQNEAIHMVEEAYVEAESAWRILKLYDEGGLVKQTQRAWEGAKLAYRNEEMPLMEYVESFNTYLETVTQYYQARADYGKALARLQYEVGETGIKGEQK